MDIQKFHPHTVLSDREKTIIRLLVKAHCRKSIATTLNVSIHTVDTHLRHIRLKTNTHSLTELVIWALNDHPVNDSAANVIT